MDRPDYLTEEHLNFLYEMRKIGAFNMFEAPLHLREIFGLNQLQAKEVFKYWCDNFDVNRR